jgi:serine/threonine-protein kinase
VTQKLPEQQVGRYAIFDQIAAGGMARVHLARLAGQEGFSRVVAVKRMHRHLLENSEFKRMFLEEARLAARIRHPNVVPILDVIATGDELVIVMEYVHGVSIHALMLASVKAKAHMPRPIVYAMLMNTLHGLHAAHEARDEKGELLLLVHRDVSPQNILVGVDGVSRVLDFGVARAVRAKQDTDPGVLKGKHSYMAPELIEGGVATRQSDVFSAAVLFWELLTGRKLFAGATEQERMNAISKGNYDSPAKYVPGLRPELERIVMRGIAPRPADRYATALEMVVDLEANVQPATPRVVGEWVGKLGHEELARRVELIQQIETTSADLARTSFPPELAEPTVSPTKAYTSTLAGEKPVSKTPKRPLLLGAAALFGVLLFAVVAWVRSASRAEPEASRVAAAPPASVTGAVVAAADTQPVEAEPKPPEPAFEPAQEAPADASEGPAPRASTAATAALAPSATVEPRWQAPPKPKEFLPNEL